VRSLLPRLLLAGSLTPLAGAQSVFGGGDHPAIAFPDLPASVTRTHAGDFDGDHHVDVMARAGGHILYLYAPPHYRAVLEHDAGALDTALARGKGPDGTAALVVSTNAGPELLAYTPATDPPFTTTALPVTQAGWAGAQRVLLSRDGDDVLFGVDAAGTSVLVCEGLFSGAVDDHAPVPVGGTVLDMVRVDWAGDGDDELCVLHTGGIAILARDGTSLLSLGGALDLACATTIRESGATHERVAAVLSSPSTTDETLNVLGATAIDAPVNLGPADVHGIAAARLDDDADDDLVLAHGADLTPDDIAPLVFFNVSDGQAPVPNGSSYTLDPGDMLALAMGVGADAGSEQQSWPALADLDRDGDIDLLYLLEGDDTARVVRNTVVAHTDYELRADDGTAYLMYASESPGAPLSWSCLSLDVDAPALDLPGEHYYVVQRVAWLEQDGSMQVTDPALAEVVVSSGGAVSHLLEPDQNHDVFFDLNGWEGPGYCHLEVSQALVVGGEVGQLGPPKQVLLSLHPDDTDDLALGMTVFDLGIWEEFGAWPPPDETTNFTLGGRDGGGIGPDVDPPRTGGDEDGGGDGSGEGGPPDPPPPPPPPGP